MKLNSLFPADYRAFCCGRLSVCVEAFGGIDSISLLDIREFEGKLYPDRFPVPWFKRYGKTAMGRPLFSPAVQFRHGKELFVPAYARLYPFGFVSDSYSMAMSESAIAVRLNVPKGEELNMTVSKLHMFEGRGDSLKNQLSVIASNIQWLPVELRGPDFDPAVPFPENGVEYLRNEPCFDNGKFFMFIECRYHGVTQNQHCCVRFPAGTVCREIPNGWCFSSEAEGVQEIVFGFGTCADEAERYADSTFDELFAHGEKRCRPAVKMSIEGLPEAGKFATVHAGYQRHLLFAETESGAAIRAAADKYGFFMLWDHVYPIRDFILNGEYALAKKALRYAVNYPWVETCPWITMHIILTVNEYLAFTGDTEFLAESMGQMERYFNFSKGFADDVTGLLTTSMNCGVDCSKEVGLEKLFKPSCLNGWWYDSLRVLENFAVETGKPELAKECRSYGDKAEAHYVKTFFNPDAGYLRAAVNGDGSLPQVEIFQNTHTLGMDYVYGEYLMRRIVSSLATYQAEKLYHPMGHTAVSPDSQVPCEMWKAVHMNQHLGHECKTARLGGRPEEALRVMKGYLEYFRKYLCAVETFNLAGADGNNGHYANWQAFSATGAMQGLLGGVLGWQCHRGGWSWTPGATAAGRLDLPTQSLEISGDGAYASGVELDGVFYTGTLQTVSHWQKCVVHRTAEMPPHPVLISAVDCPVSGVEVKEGALSFTMKKNIHTTLKIQLPTPGLLTVNGRECPAEWDGQIIWYDGDFTQGDKVEV